MRASWSPCTRTIEPEVEQLIEQSWQRAIATGIKLFDGAMCRLEAWKATDATLQLVLSETTYKTFFGTNLTAAQMADRYGPQVLANPVGVSSALMTSDGFLALGRRNAAVAYYPNRIHPFAGALEPKDAGDVFEAVRRELQEELAIQPREIVEISCAGIAQDRSLRQPELIFPTRLKLSGAEVESRLDAEEHRACYMVALNNAALEKALDDPMLTPIAAATVMVVHRAGA